MYVNDYKTKSEAIKAWNSDGWKWERNYFNFKRSAAICKEKGKTRFFIITHPKCVAYRMKMGQIVKLLN